MVHTLWQKKNWIKQLQKVKINLHAKYIHNFQYHDRKKKQI